MDVRKTNQPNASKILRTHQVLDELLCESLVPEFNGQVILTVELKDGYIKKIESRREKKHGLS